MNEAGGVLNLFSTYSPHHPWYSLSLLSTVHKILTLVPLIFLARYVLTHFCRQVYNWQTRNLMASHQSSIVSTWLGSSRGRSIPACSASRRLTASVAVAGGCGGSDTRDGVSKGSCGSPELRRERESGGDGLRGP